MNAMRTDRARSLIESIDTYKKVGGDMDRKVTIVELVLRLHPDAMKLQPNSKERSACRWLKATALEEYFLCYPVVPGASFDILNTEIPSIHDIRSRLQYIVSGRALGDVDWFREYLIEMKIDGMLEA